MSGADPAPGEGEGDGARERLRAPLARLGWQAYEALLYLLGAAVTIALHLGLMMLLSVTGVVMQRLVIEVVAGEGWPAAAAVTEAAASVFVLAAAAVVAAFGALKVVMRAWRDFRSED